MTSHNDYVGYKELIDIAESVRNALIATPETSMFTIEPLMISPHGGYLITVFLNDPVTTLDIHFNTLDKGWNSRMNKDEDPMRDFNIQMGGYEKHPARADYLLDMRYYGGFPYVSSRAFDTLVDTIIREIKMAFNMEQVNDKIK